MNEKNASNKNGNEIPLKVFRTKSLKDSWNIKV